MACRQWVDAEVHAVSAFYLLNSIHEQALQSTTGLCCRAATAEPYAVVQVQIQLRGLLCTRTRLLLRHKYGIKWL